MRHNEKGSTLLMLMGVVLIFSAMMSALLALALQQTWNTTQMLNQSQALMDCRTGMQSVYNGMQAMWKSLIPANGFSSISQAESALSTLQVQMQQWCNTQFSNAPVSATVQLGTNNFNAVANGSASASQQSVGNLYQNYEITVTAREHGVHKTLTDTFTISGTLEALSYAVYTPGNLFITGGPEIDGRLAVGSATYFDDHAWEGLVVGHYPNPSYLTYEGSSLDFYRENDTNEPIVLPNFGSGAALNAGAGIYRFTRFNDQSAQSDGTWHFGDGSSVSVPVSISPDRISQVSTGSVSIGPFTSLLPSDYVSQIIQMQEGPIKSQAQKVGNLSSPGYGEQPDISNGGYVHGSYDVKGNTSVNGILYIDGNLTVESGANLNLTQELYVNGDLTVNGILTSTAAIYVNGNTTITNVPPDTPGIPPSRLELFSLKDITLTLLTYGNASGIATEPTTFHTFLASNNNIYLEGMESFYHIIGGIAGQNVILNATVGVSHTYSGNLMKSLNPSDTTRRLWITYDNSYVTNPLVGTPTMGDLKLQPMPQPTLVSSSGS